MQRGEGNKAAALEANPVSAIAFILVHISFVSVRFPYVRSVRSDQSALLKWSGMNDPADGSEPLSSPASVGR